MAGSSFRFIHTSDFHLDQPLGGLTEIPEELIEPLIDAPYRAVDRVVDAALQERVDFVLLTGDIIHFPTASPRAVDFLRVQLSRLHEKKIPTYWLGGRLEAGNSPPEDFTLPKSVHRFPASRVQRLEVRRGKKTIAYLVGQSAGEHAFANLDEMRCPRDGRFFAGLWYGDVQSEVDSDQLDDLGIDYWALGGSHRPQKLDTTIPAQYCGTPQGRLPAEQGPHGCVLVQVTGEDVETRFIETDVIRYQIERLELDSAADQQQLASRISDRLRSLKTGLDSKRHLLLTWAIINDGPFGRQLRRVGQSERMLARLQRDLRDLAGSNIWNVGMRSLRGEVPSRLLEEDTILGDFLRVVRDMEQTDDRVLDVHSYLPNTPAANQLAETLHLDDVATRRQLLRDVATIGIDMLSGD